MQVSLFSDPDYRLWVWLERVRGALLKARGIELTRYGISAVEAFALFVISDIGGNATPAEISRRTSREHNTVMALISRMEKKGLVTRARDTEKKHGWRVSLSGDGEIACQQAMRLASVHAAMSGISMSQKQTLESTLKKIYDGAARRQVDEAMIGWGKIPDISD